MGRSVAPSRRHEPPPCALRVLFFRPPPPQTQHISYLMPKRPVREGFGESTDRHAGWRDKAGVINRPGRAVFAMASYDAWANLPAGKAPVRLYRCFKWSGDRLGKYRLDVEYTWCLNHPMLMAMGERVWGVVPQQLLEIMEQNHDVYLESNWAVSEEFETILGDVHVLRLAMEGGAVTNEMPANDTCARFIAGRIDLALTASGALAWYGGRNYRFYENYATGFTRWELGASLASLAAYPGNLPPPKAVHKCMAEEGMDFKGL